MLASSPGGRNDCRLGTRLNSCMTHYINHANLVKGYTVVLHVSVVLYLKFKPPILLDQYLYNQFSMTSASAIVVVAVCAVVCIGYVDALPSSCDDICQSGDFLIDTEDIVYCSVEELCGSTGWRRVGIADFRNSSTSCPDGLVVYDGAVRGCQRETTSSTNSVTIPTSGISYSQVCGKVLGYPYHTVDAFVPQWTGSRDIEGKYLDGISVTYGPEGSRQHIFSLAGGGGDGTICPCAASSLFPDSQPDFVGDDYYCESGGSGDDDILWDGEQCDGDEADCCTAPYMPFFYKDLSTSTTEDIELRILVNQGFGDENIYLLAYEIYVK